MNILILGAGGREHALAWKVAQSPLAERVYVAPGNGGTAGEPGVENVGIDPLDDASLLHFVQSHNVALVIVGPEAPLVAGVADRFAEAGVPCFGPSAAAAQLEGSKAFAKAFMARYGIPTGSYATFTDHAAALDHAHALGVPLVIKADGLAAGKGVIVAHEPRDAEAAISAMLKHREFGAAGQRIVIEEFLQGEEASFIAMVDGEHMLSLATSQDHKPRDDGDRGPNTGGMGAYSPAPVVTPAVEARILRELMLPTLAGLRAEGIHYRGFLYLGLMIEPDGTPKVLEYNCRLGDPEAQPILMRLDGDLVAICQAAVQGRLAGAEARWRPAAALGVVLASAGYPGPYGRGLEIRGLAPDGAQEGDAPDEADCVKVFHAGTRRLDGRVVTDGGRVLCVTALGQDIAAAASAAYRAADCIDFEGCFFRGDIGHRALGKAR